MLKHTLSPLVNKINSYLEADRLADELREKVQTALSPVDEKQKRLIEFVDGAKWEQLHSLERPRLIRKVLRINTNSDVHHALALPKPSSGSDDRSHTLPEPPPQLLRLSKDCQRFLQKKSDKDLEETLAAAGRFIGYKWFSQAAKKYDKVLCRLRSKGKVDDKFRDIQKTFVMNADLREADPFRVGVHMFDMLQVGLDCTKGEDFQNAAFQVVTDLRKQNDQASKQLASQLLGAGVHEAAAAIAESRKQNNQPGNPLANQLLGASGHGAAIDIEAPAGSSLTACKRANLADIVAVPEAVHAFVATIALGDKAKAVVQGVNSTLLLYGEPGTGKTLTARGIAGEFPNYPFFTANTSAMVDCLVGNTAKNVHAMFNALEETAAQYGKVVVLLDEADGLLIRRGGPNSHQEYGHATNAFLDRIEGPRAVKNVIFIATTNRYNELDAAAISRFQTSIELQPLDPAALYECKLKERDHVLTEQDVKDLAEQSTGLGGRDIFNVLNNAGRMVVLRHNRDKSVPMELTFDDIATALHDYKSRPQVSKRNY